VDFLEDTTLSADIGVYYSGILRQQREELLNVTHKKQRLNLPNWKTRSRLLNGSLSRRIWWNLSSMMHRTLLGKTPLPFSVSGKPTKAQ
jgi:hypothetical protein